MTVRGSRIPELEVIESQQKKRVTARVVVVLVVLFLIVAAFVGGQLFGLAEQRLLKYEHEKLAMEKALLEKENEQLKLEIASARLGADTADDTENELKRTIKKLMDEKAAFAEENEFYKNILAPNESDKGLRIGNLELTPTTLPGRYKYRITLMQIASRTAIRGTFTALVKGSMNGERLELPMNEVNEEWQQPYQKFGFKYFNHYSGEIVLPEGFLPEAITVKASSSGSKPKHVEKTFEWSKQEIVADVGQE